MISGNKNRLHYISCSYIGANHDFSLLKSEFPPEIPWFKNYHIQLDLGFQGFSKLYPCAKLEIPHKKPKGEELENSKKEINKKMASKRVTVEHTIGGLKRYRILSDRLRIKDFTKYDEILGVCAGLWNFYISD